MTNNAATGTPAYEWGWRASDVAMSDERWEQRLQADAERGVRAHWRKLQQLEARRTGGYLPSRVAPGSERNLSISWTERP